MGRDERLLLFREVVADFAAFQAVVLAVFAEAHLVGTLAYRTIFVTVTILFNAIAHRATESFGHGRRVARIAERGKRLLTTKDTKEFVFLGVCAGVSPGRNEAVAHH
jgi:hypothetical protein